MLKKINKYLVVGKTSLQSSLAYTSDFLFGTLFYTLIIFIFLQLWRTIYGGEGNTMAGFSLNQMIWYCIITEMITLSGNNVFSELNTDIKSGSIAYLLTRPYNYVFYQLSNALGTITIKLIINSITGFILGLLFVGILSGFKIVHLPFLAITIAMGILINFFLLASLGLTAFWIEENSAFYWIYQKFLLMLGTFLPLDFLPLWLQKITKVLPFAYISYGPGRLASDFSLSNFVDLFTGQLIYLTFAIALSSIVFMRGVKKVNVNGG